MDIFKKENLESLIVELNNLSCRESRARQMSFFNELKSVSQSIRQDYNIIKIPKKVGERTIFIPNYQLKKIQKIVHRQILRKIYKEWNTNIYGLHTGSNVMHTNEHKDSRYIFQFDIKDAFPSININILKKVLLEKFSKELKCYKLYIDRYKDHLNELEKIKKSEDFSFLDWEKDCLEYAWTDVKYSPFYQIFEIPENLDVKKSAEELADIVIDLTTYKGILPQGTSTASFLFYIYLERYLSRRGRIISKWHHIFYKDGNQNCKISCYIDGFVISSDKPISPEIRKKILQSVKEDMGFEINKSKTRYQDCRNGAIMITGLVVDGTGKVRLSQKTIKKWRGIIHNAEVTRDPELIKRVEGFMAYIQFVYGKNIPAQIAKPYIKLQNPP